MLFNKKKNNENTASSIAHTESFSNHEIIDEFHEKMCAKWGITNSGIFYKDHFYNWDTVLSVKFVNDTNSKMINGVYAVTFDGCKKDTFLAWGYKSKDRAINALDFILKNTGLKLEFAKNVPKIARKNHANAMKKRFSDSLASVPKHDIILDTDYKLKRQHLKDMPEIKCQNITKSFNKSSLPAYVVIDTETTGLKARSDKIIELSAILYEGGDPVSAFSTLVNPEIHIPDDASMINHIYDDDVSNAPTLDAVAQDFINFVGNCPIVAYNAPFDLQFLYCSGIDLIGKRKIFDALTLARKAYKNKIDTFRLSDVCEFLDIYFDAHSSLSDCFATGMVFKDIIDTILYKF